ncbi:MAG: hypothetical protein IKC58_04690 [Clostridia bacterium]|nr:hypothetical protein [Clostridia bacterium]
MIEFNGMPSGEFAEYVVKNHRKAGLRLSIIPTIIMCAIVIVIALVIKQPVVLIGLLLPIMLVILLASQPFEKDVPKLFATQITISEDGEMFALGYFEKHYRAVSSVETVIDIGSGYIIEFEYEVRNPFFLCQKDLIVKGSIEQFEELFKDKIVRLDENK